MSSSRPFPEGARLHDLLQFLSPWIETTARCAQALGWTVEDVDPESPAYRAAQAVYDAYYAFDDLPTAEALKAADYLLTLLVGGEPGDFLAQSFIPDEFWETVSGNMIVSVVQRGLGEEFVAMREAAKALGITETRLYHMANTRRVPCMLDMTERNRRRRRRFRLDKLRPLNLADDEE